METFYRKYRPQTIADLDLASVRETLKKSVGSGKFAQAYLFVGPRGAGKTSAARILAKAINCQTPKDGEPCLNCEMCTAIEGGSCIDVLEIDAASHRGIDAIRELRDKIGLAPVSAKKKVYIIDEVHMLTTEAFNALLKTLEEPPSHALFILCTTESHKVPETIVSRCVSVNFKKGTVEEIVRSLSKVVDGEKMEVEEGILEELARSVDGSFREGHKLLQELAQSGEKITFQALTQLFGQVRGVVVENLAKLMLAGEVKMALEELGKAEKDGVNWPSFAERLLNYLRGQLKAKYGIGELKVEVSEQRIREVTERVAKACEEMKNAVVQVLPLELAVVELGGNGKVTEVVRKERVEVVVEEKELVKEEVKVEEKEEKGEAVAMTGTVSVSIDDVQNKWRNLIEILEPKNHSVAGFLRSCRPKSIEDRFLVIEAYYKFHKEQLEQEARRRLLEEVLRAQVGVPAVRFVLGEKAAEAAAKMTQDDNVGAPSGDDKLIEAVGDVFGVEV